MARWPAQTSDDHVRLLPTVAAAFDRLAAGVLILGDCGRVLFANDAAKSLLAAGDGLVVEHSGKVEIANSFLPSAGSSLAGSSAILLEARTRNGLLISVPRSGELLPLTLIIRPSRVTTSRLQEDSQVFVVLIHNPDSDPDLQLSGLRQLYQLTLTEVRLAGLMMQGKTTEGCARVMGVRQSTVKMHLRNLCGKTGVQRQSELIALLFTSLAGVRSSGTEPVLFSVLVPAAQQVNETADRGRALAGELSAC